LTHRRRRTPPQVAHAISTELAGDTVRDAINAHLQMAGDTVAVLAASLAALISTPISPAGTTSTVSSAAARR
jgi:hypothetical protein